MAGVDKLLSLEEILFERFKRKTLAHFYIISLPSNDLQMLGESGGEFLGDWNKQFLRRVLRHSINWEKIEIDHPDILVIKNSSGGEYLIKDFDPFFDFIQFRPFELKQRFIVIEDGHLLSTVLSNKLLKTLEAPNSNITIFLHNPVNKKLLPTISSRAIQLRPICQKEIGSEEELVQFKKNVLEKLGNQAGELNLMEKIKSSARLQNYLLKLCIVQGTTARSFSAKEALLQNIKMFSNAQKFHNPPASRIYLLMRTLENLTT